MKNPDKETVGKDILHGRVNVFKSKIPNIVRSLFLWSVGEDFGKDFNPKRNSSLKNVGSKQRITHLQRTAIEFWECKCLVELLAEPNCSK